MSFTNLTFTPSDGWKNNTSFPSDFSSEADVRAALQLLFDQIRDYLNTKLVAELSDTSVHSGADQIGAHALFEGDVSAANVMEKLVYLRKQIEDVIYHGVADKAITAEKFADGCINEGKLADGSVSRVKMSGSFMETLYNRMDSLERNVSQLFMKTITGFEVAKNAIFYDGFVDTSMVDQAYTNAVIETCSRLSGNVDSFVVAMPSGGFTEYENVTFSKNDTVGFSFTVPAKSGYAVSSVTIRLAPLGMTNGNIIGSIRTSLEADDLASTKITIPGYYQDCTFTFSDFPTLTAGGTYFFMLRFDTNNTIGSMASHENFPQTTCVTVISTNAGSKSFSPNGYTVVFKPAAEVSYQTTAQNLYISGNAATLYLRKSSAAGFVVTPKLKLYNSGSEPEFTAMVKDEAFLSPAITGNTEIEEKWDLLQSSKGTLAKLKLTLSGGAKTDYVKSYGVIAAVK